MSALAPDLPARSAALRVLGAYLLFGAVLSTVRWVQGTSAGGAVATYAGLLVLVAIAFRSRRDVAVVTGDWLPLLALPLLYAAIPATALGSGVHDAVVQSLDEALFGTAPAQTLSRAFPFAPLSELLHAAYLSYYLIIYVPPLVMYARGERESFRVTVLAFTIAMTACFAVFCVFPVEGPRYAWGTSGAVPGGPIRSFALMLLEEGSSRGTAFPSSHQAISVSIGLTAFGWRRGAGASILGVSALLGMGAVYGGFHYAVDMLAGAGFGWLAWLTAGRWVRPTAAVG